MEESLERIAYDASTRTLDKQERLLDELRARTGLLLATSSLATSFLGRPAFEDANGLVIVLVFVAFAISITASVYVLLPKARRFVFSLEGSAVFENLFPYREDVDEIYRRLTYDLDRFWEENDAVLARLFRAFEVAAFALAAEIILLLAAVSDTLL